MNQSKKSNKTHGPPGDTPAPNFMIPDRDGIPFVLKESLEYGPVLLVFLSDDSSVCRETLPYLRRLEALYQGGESFADEVFQLVGISQDGMPARDEFQASESIRMAIDTVSLDVSSLFEIQMLPTLVLVETDGRVALRSEGFVRRDFERLAQVWAETIDYIPRLLFAADEVVPTVIGGSRAKNVLPSEL